MTAFFISLLAVLVVIAWHGDFTIQKFADLRRRSCSDAIATASVCLLLWMSAFCVAEQPKAESQVAANTTTQDSRSNMTAVVKQDETRQDASAPQVAEDSNDIVFVMTKDGLNKLIAASGGSVEAFDVQTLKQASAFMPLSLNQSGTFSSVLRTTASPMLLRGLLNAANLKAIQKLLRDSYPNHDTESTTLDHAAWDQFLKEHSWIENPGIGQVVAKTGMIEQNRSDEIAKEVRAAINAAVAVRIQNLAQEKYGAEEVDVSTMDLSVFDPSKVIVQTAQWEERVYENGSSDNVMVQTHVLVDLSQQEIAALMTGVKKRLQQNRLQTVGITIGLFWLGIAISSIVFRTCRSESRAWKMIVIPMLTMAVIPCLAAAGFMISQMTKLSLF